MKADAKMENTSKLLELRNEAKKRKPDFIRQDTHKKPSLPKKWKKPRGLHSKMRLNKKGYRRSVSKGFRSPALVRGFYRKGKALLCATEKDLEKAKQENCFVILASLGQRKKAFIVKKAEELGLEILNIPKNYLKQVEENLKSRKEKKEQHEREKKEQQKKEKESLDKKVKDQDKEKEKLSDEEKKKEEQRIRDKVLTS